MLKRILKAGCVAAALIGAAGAVQAQDVTLKLHQLLPERATIPAKFLIPWAAKVEKESGGRIKIEHYPSMQLGGKPPELVQQVTDGVVDMIWTVMGYTPGRFPRAEAFELPFMVTNGEQTSRAFYEYFDKHMQNDFPGMKVIAVHTHGPGLLHTKDPVNSLEDIKGMKLRGPTRVITQMLDSFGAVPVGMPVPAVPEAVSKGVIDGAVIPWEITLPLKMAELVGNHTEFSGDRGLYSATFLFAMNQASYDALPDDLKKVIDDNSGIEAAAWAGRAMDGGDVVGRKKAAEKGNNIIVLDEAETNRWKEAAAPVVDNWVAEMKDKGIDGQALVDDAQALLKKNSM
ncbi:TRAP transporter substrate-binding protein [Hwanghaeella grinnelliae]|uniref:TRAP transporter substrate-binding protein n=1 Tax=Hwanghaeella grinnelliae TaxID=2500179 RepID=A0A437QUK4_9PROT|nr:TRAP transporter substrate-binding protein [Hwanghaeella grinnelliae]RVU38185.1 TRAP transporter substrate-binding protein [Hwanghaeella grinnelliae]